LPALATELAPVRVNVVMPGLVDTPIHKQNHAETKAWAEAHLPVRYFGQPADIAEMILAIAANPYITGQTVVIDGGLTRL
jgi:NAD(P)-dependent dehydrogenase (short-subunit alcohol dehydrogenase family)